MLSLILTLGALVDMAQSKAIVTNQCKHDVYVWSVPGSDNFASGVPVKAGSKYEEVFRRGTTENSGIAIKISPTENGISEGGDEIDFAYTVDEVVPSQLWINLNNVRGHAYGSNVSFFTCYGSYKTPYVPTRQCNINDNVELVFCGKERTEPAVDATPSDVLKHCVSSPWLKRKAGEKHPRNDPQCHGHVVTPKKPNSEHNKELRSKGNHTEQHQTDPEEQSPFSPHVQDDEIDYDCACRNTVKENGLFPGAECDGAYFKDHPEDFWNWVCPNVTLLTAAACEPYREVVKQVCPRKE